MEQNLTENTKTFIKTIIKQDNFSALSTLPEFLALNDDEKSLVCNMIIEALTYNKYKKAGAIDSCVETLSLLYKTCNKLVPQLIPINIDLAIIIGSFSILMESILTDKTKFDIISAGMHKLMMMIGSKDNEKVQLISELFHTPQK